MKRVLFFVSVIYSLIAYDLYASQDDLDNSQSLTLSDKEDFENKQESLIKEVKLGNIKALEEVKDDSLLFKLNKKKKSPFILAISNNLLSSDLTLKIIDYFFQRFLTLTEDQKYEWVYSYTGYYLNILKNSKISFDDKLKLFKKFLENDFDPDYSDKENDNLLVNVITLLRREEEKIIKFYDILFSINEKTGKPYSDINQNIVLENSIHNLILYATSNKVSDNFIEYLLNKKVDLFKSVKSKINNNTFYSYPTIENIDFLEQYLQIIVEKIKKEEIDVYIFPFEVFQTEGEFKKYNKYKISLIANITNDLIQKMFFYKELIDFNIEVEQKKLPFYQEIFKKKNDILKEWVSLLNKNLNSNYYNINKPKFSDNKKGETSFFFVYKSNILFECLKILCVNIGLNVDIARSNENVDGKFKSLSDFFKFRVNSLENIYETLLLMNIQVRSEDILEIKKICEFLDDSSKMVNKLYGSSKNIVEFTNESKKLRHKLVNELEKKYKEQQNFIEDQKIEREELVQREQQIRDQIGLELQKDQKKLEEFKKRLRKTDQSMRKIELREESNRLKLESEEISDLEKIEQSFNDRFAHLKEKETLSNQFLDTKKATKRVEIKEKALWDKILEEKKAPDGVVIQDVKNEIFKKISLSHQIINQSLLFEAGKPKNLYGKKITINLDHIINIYPEIRSDRQIELKGGHLYQTIEQLILSGVINNPKAIQDLKTKSWKFEGDSVIGNQKIVKVTFPEDWTPEDIYKAIINGKKISEESDGIATILIIEISHKKLNLQIKLILYPSEDKNILNVVTAYPILEVKAGEREAVLPVAAVQAKKTQVKASGSLAGSKTQAKNVQPEGAVAKKSMPSPAAKSS